MTSDKAPIRDQYGTDEVPRRSDNPAKKDPIGPTRVPCRNFATPIRYPYRSDEALFCGVIGAIVYLISTLLVPYRSLVGVSVHKK